MPPHDPTLLHSHARRLAKIEWCVAHVLLPPLPRCRPLQALHAAHLEAMLVAVQLPPSTRFGHSASGWTAQTAQELARAARAAPAEAAAVAAALNSAVTKLSQVWGPCLLWAVGKPKGATSASNDVRGPPSLGFHYS